MFGVFLLLGVVFAIGDASYKTHLSETAKIPASAADTPTKSSPLSEQSVYIALGDSYSAGGGADRTPVNLAIDASAYDTSTKCWRSRNAAQYLVAKDLNLKLTDASCGGAVTDSLLKPQQEGVAAQLDSITSDTKLVTMTIGGNDTALLYALNCMATSDCANNALMTTLINLRILGLPANLSAIYKQIHAKAPSATIRHAGYPHIVAAPGEPTGTCKAWLTADEQKSFHDLLVGTNNKIKDTIQQFAKDSGADAAYVDPLADSSPFMQRDGTQMLDGCSTSTKRYMNGPNDGAEGGWHPNIYGQQMYADIYESSLQ